MLGALVVNRFYSILRDSWELTTETRRLRSKARRRKEEDSVNHSVNSVPSWLAPQAIIHKFLVTLAVGKHPFPFRTRQLSPPAPMVLTCLRVGRVGRCQDYL